MNDKVWLIDKNALNIQICHSKEDDPTQSTEWKLAHDNILGIIRDAPTVEAAQVVQGEWVYDDGDEYADHYHCSQCGKEIDTCNEIVAEPTPNYCPNCGCDMREGL